MSEELNLAAQYREHARNLRAAAQFDDVENTRRLLIGKAKEFEGLAESLEEIDKTNSYMQRANSDNGEAVAA